MTFQSKTLNWKLPILYVGGKIGEVDEREKSEGGLGEIPDSPLRPKNGAPVRGVAARGGRRERGCFHLSAHGPRVIVFRLRGRLGIGALALDFANTKMAFQHVEVE